MRTMRPREVKQLTQDHTANKQPGFELGSSGLLSVLLSLQSRPLIKYEPSSSSHIGGGPVPVSCTCLGTRNVSPALALTSGCVCGDQRF